MIGADFDTAYSIPFIMGPAPYQYEPVCNPPDCFVGSYAPITHAGKSGPFLVNTYFLQPNRRHEIAGPVLLRSGMFKCNA